MNGSMPIESTCPLISGTHSIDVMPIPYVVIALKLCYKELGPLGGFFGLYKYHGW